MATVQGLKERIESGKEELEQVDAKLGELALTLPNLPDPDAPEGMTEEDAVVVREVGELPSSTSSRATTSRSAPSST